jgi:hypothetical protein
MRIYLLRWTVAPLRWWRRATWLSCQWSVDQAVLEQSTPRRSYSGLLSLLLFLGGTDGIVLSDGNTHELVEGLALEGHQMLTYLRTHPFSK